MYTETACAARWAHLVAPRLGVVRDELVDDLANYLQIGPDVVRAQLTNATSAFADEWRQRVSNPANAREVVRFYEESTTELFDLAEWHASDTIHFRTLVCLDLAAERRARTVLDYGSGIGSDAMAFAAAGFQVTLADVSGPLLAFATWRCRQRGFDVRAIDLKREALPEGAHDAAICFDVLEHVPNPVRILYGIHRSLRPGALFFMHAPFGVDHDRPMHIVEKDVVTPWMRAVGFRWREDAERSFPDWLWAPRAYECQSPGVLERAGYYLHDVAFPGESAKRLARWYRRLAPLQS